VKIPLLLAASLALTPLFAVEHNLAYPFASYFNSNVCDQVINKDVLTICYDYNYKAALAVGYKLRGDRVSKSIEKRPQFYKEPALRGSYAAVYKDYTRSGYDRGHMAPDASFDYSPTALNQTYSMANIVAQAPTVNRRLWVKAEKYERQMAIKLGVADVLNVVVYPQVPKRIGSGVAVPSGFWKRVSSAEAGFERCFYYENDLNANAKGDRLKDHVVECSQLLGLGK